jgi:hypothetical protein
MHQCELLGRGCPKRGAPSCVASRQWLPIGQIIVEIEIGIEIDEIDEIDEIE